MKKIIGASVIVGGLVALRRFGPKLAEQCMTKCHSMLNRMPNDFPLKRMMLRMERSQEEGTAHHLEAGTEEGTLAAAN